MGRLQWGCRRDELDYRVGQVVSCFELVPKNIQLFVVACLGVPPYRVPDPCPCRGCVTFAPIDSEWIERLQNPCDFVPVVPYLEFGTFVQQAALGILGL